MIPNNLAVAEVDNHLGGTKYKMGIDPSVMGHIMGLLTRLYKDEELACIREYATNAWDSHIDAGKTDRPIVVTTPTRLSNYLRIRDEGVGMNEADIERVYSQYGVSTKRDQTNTNGTMGVGGKSALAYTTSFNVIGIKDGVKTFVNVSREADGSGSMEVVEVTDTDEPNGVEIVIPAKTYNSFGSKARDFFSYWKPGMVLLDGVEPSKIDTFTKMSDRTYIVNSPTDYIVMGNVAYPLDSGHTLDKDQRLSYGKSVVAFVEMNKPGQVVFTPSREGLIYDEITLASIRDLRIEFSEALGKAIENRISKAKTAKEAMDAASDLRNDYRSLPQITWNGQVVPQPHEYMRDSNNLPIKGLRWAMQQARYAVSSNVAATYNMHVVYGYPYMDGNSVSSTNKRKVRQFLSDNLDTYGRVNNILFVDSAQPFRDNIWYDDARLIDWKEIAKIKLPRPQSTGSSYGGGRKMDGNYDKWDSGYWRLADISNEKEIFWTTKQEFESFEKYLYDFSHWFPDAVVVKVGLNRLGKFQRDFPHAVKLTMDIVNAQFVEMTKALTEVEKDYLTRFVTHGHVYENNKPFIEYAADKLHDKRVKRLGELYENGFSTTAKILTTYYGMNQHCQNAVKAVANAHKQTTDIGNFEIRTEYPLVRSYLDRYLYDDVVLYMNAKYDSLNNKEKK